MCVCIKVVAKTLKRKKSKSEKVLACLHGIYLYYVTILTEESIDINFKQLMQFDLGKLQNQLLSSIILLFLML